MAGAIASGSEVFTDRQAEVLASVLALMVEEGDAFSMTAVARRANCSKETLYKWFGDRDGLLAATVQWRASEVQPHRGGTGATDRQSLRQNLVEFAASWLRVISSDSSLALNRVAIAHAGSGRSNLGKIVLANGRFAIARRLKPVLEAGRDAGLLAFDDGETAFRTFFGLIGRDVQVRLLLGDDLELDGDTIRRDAETAADQFLALYGAAGEEQ